MRFLNSATAAITMGIILFLTFSTLGAMYDDYVLKSEPGDLDFLGYFLDVIIITPMITAILIFVFYRFYIKLNVRSILFSGVCSLWVYQLVGLLINMISLYTPIHYMEYFNILPINLFILAYLLLMRKSAWLYINGFSIGTIMGLLSSYCLVILLRHLNNSLISYHYMDEEELTLLLVATFLGALIGNIIEKKRTSEQ
ncbi:hypothetical protein [Peribacillus loiseleuriae]|uniref:Uncharacterized protein n=1 Tax=Peribacillus loiseleuriae TaxID=1679170 RepID=A0A0K9GTC7_9BACI|nr:hypothetical protein [Peribacillus loiseleuriae]KMY49878.1 hypothetical protein AC625_10345 [Peribacillus loiseleuriae]